MTRAVFQMLGMVFVFMMLLNRYVILAMVFLDRCLRWMGAMLSGPKALDGLEFFMAVMVCSVEIKMGVVFRFWICLSMMRLFLSGVKLVGFVKYWLKDSAMLLLVDLILSLNLIERFGSELVGVLLFRALIVFQYLF